jgi:hypothetical protein
VATGFAIPVFCASLALTLGSTVVFARELDRLSERLRVSEGLHGILTALGADAPEIATAVTALVASRETVGVGVVVGSTSSTRRPARAERARRGTCALPARALAQRRRRARDHGRHGALVLLRRRGRGRAAARRSLRPCGRALFGRGDQEADRGADSGSRAGCPREAVDSRTAATREGLSRLDLAVPPASLGAIVLGSIGMVVPRPTSATAGAPDVIVGTLVLAALTSLPNPDGGQARAADAGRRPSARRSTEQLNDRRHRHPRSSHAWNAGGLGTFSCGGCGGPPVAVVFAYMGHATPLKGAW